MATTKTLTPTNQQITIAAFSGEKPDQRQIADAETKLADAVNALSSSLAQLVKIKSYQDSEATTTRTLTVPRGSLHYIVVFYGYMSASWVGMVQMTASGGLRILEIKSGGNVTIGTANDTLTFTVTNAQYFRFLDIVINGNGVS